MKTVLSEEEYLTRLGAILKRDFFPTLQDDELSAFSAEEQLSISEFQRLFTTEDNASFEELLARENERKRNKFERVYGGPAALVDNPSQRLLLRESEVDEHKFKSPNKNKGLLKWKSETEVVDNKRPQINVHNTRFIKRSEERASGGSKAFRIQSTPAREQLAHTLDQQSKASSTLRVSKQSSTPRAKTLYSMTDLKALTPSRKNK